MGIKLFVSVWPTVDPKSPNYPEMLEKGYLVHTDRGNPHQLECGGYEVFYDATNPGAGSLYGKRSSRTITTGESNTIGWTLRSRKPFPYHFRQSALSSMGSAPEVANIYPLLL